MPDQEHLIAFFGSSQQLNESVDSVARALGYFVKTYIYSLEEALAAAPEIIERDRAEVVVSLRGTSEMLRRKVELPVLSLQSANRNLLEGIYNASQVTDSIFLALYKTEEFDTRFLENILHVKIYANYYSDAKTLKRAIEEISRVKGISVVGGGRACGFARLYGLLNFLVLPTPTEIAVALENAQNVALSRGREKNLLERYTALLDVTSEGIITVAPNNVITMANKKAQTLLSATKSLVGKKLFNVVPELAPQRGGKKDKNKAPAEEKSYVRRVNGNPFFFSSAPLGEEGAEGTLYSFQPAYAVMQAGKQVHKAISSGHIAKYTLEDFIYASPRTGQVLEKIRLFAKSDSTVLITGESGTGKEILANALHHSSKRSSGPFVSVNCGAIPAQLLESELFGYEGGSFTGSRSEGKPGLFEMADNGTLFLDEINSMPLNVQALLLRTLQEGEIRRVGGGSVIPLDVRIVAATNKPLMDEVRDGRIRDDLFYRLNVLAVTVPPLRDRPEDIPPIAEFFIKRESQKAGMSHPFLLPEACMQMLCDLPWNGNTRELRHFIERLVLLSKGSFNKRIFDELFSESSLLSKRLMQNDLCLLHPSKPAAPTTKEDIENALFQAGGKKGIAAEMLGISRTTLWRFMRTYKL